MFAFCPITYLRMQGNVGAVLKRVVTKKTDVTESVNKKKTRVKDFVKSFLFNLTFFTYLRNLSSVMVLRL